MLDVLSLRSSLLFARRLGLACAAMLLAAPGGVGAQTFSEVSVAAGVSYTQTTIDALCFAGICDLERMTGGAAVSDVDGDGDVDLFVTRFDAPDLLFCNQGAPSWTFSDCTAASGLTAYDLHSNGAAFGDIDNDGDDDLFVTTYDDPTGRFYLFINDGSGVFTEEAVARGAAAQVGTGHFVGMSVAFGDYDRDGYLDVFTTEWRADFVAPEGTPVHARLLRNQGAANPGHFSDETVAAGVDASVISPFVPFSFAAAFSDIDGDGWQDLVITSDFGNSKLYWNDGDGTFSDGTSYARVGTDQNGMGSSFADWDGDGALDWFITSIYDASEYDGSGVGEGSGNRLFRYDGGRRFRDVTDQAGVRNGDWGWGAAFFDFDNDRDLDIVMTNGITFPGNSPAWFVDPMRLWRNDGHGVAMVEIAASVGVTDTEAGKGLLVFDYDEDGDLDVFVVNNASTPRLYRNDGGNAKDFIRVRAVGTSSNRDGIGARVWVQTTDHAPMYLAEIGNTTQYLAQSERVAHFGLGDHKPLVRRVRVQWPSGRIAELLDVPKNQTVTLTEPATAVCNDGFDNDGDGFVDHGGDPGCASAADASERGSGLVCDDGIDQDGDGFFDNLDPGCDSPSDPSENTPLWPCDNGVDDDLDLLVDYPEDPGCAAIFDAVEGEEGESVPALGPVGLFALGAAIALRGRRRRAASPAQGGTR